MKVLRKTPTHFSDESFIGGAVNLDRCTCNKGRL